MRAGRRNRLREREDGSGSAVLLLVAGILISGTVPLPAQEIEVGENVWMSTARSDRAHFEIRVAAHPSDPDVLLGAGMAWSDSAIKYDVAAYRSKSMSVTGRT